MPICYRDVGIERLEMMPSALEVVPAEDDADPVLGPLGLDAGLRQQFCRDETDPVFAGGIAGDWNGELASPP